jgi:hypothetical protein
MHVIFIANAGHKIRCLLGVLRFDVMSGDTRTCLCFIRDEISYVKCQRDRAPSTQMKKDQEGNPNSSKEYHWLRNSELPTHFLCPK